MPYALAYDWQRQLQAARIGGLIPDTLLLLTHTPVVTIGRGDKDEAGLISTRRDLAQRGIDVAIIDRGGQTTYHAPGQLVGYPILDISQLPDGRDLHKYLRRLEGMLIETLSALGLQGRRMAGCTGVWVGECKIAAIGIKVTRWVSMHGFALNLDIDLAPFRQDIVPCGIVDKGVTSLAECGVSASRLQVEQALVESFCQAFERVPETAQPTEIFLQRVQTPAPSGILRA